MFTVYSKPNCQACDRAKALLDTKGIKYELKMLDVGQPKVEGVTYVEVSELKARVPTAKSVPVIFRGEDYVGGVMELQRILG